MEIVKKNLKDLNNEEIKKIISFLKKQKVIVIKTDTIYGYSCLSSSQKAIEKIGKIKRRNLSKSYILLVSSLTMASRYGYINKWQRQKISEFRQSKKAISFILKSKNKLNKNLEKRGSLAMRLPKNDFFIKIIKRLGEPLVSTSFNFSGQDPIAIAKVEEVFKNKKYKPDLVIDSNKSRNSKASSLIDISQNQLKILRK